jgi:acyl-CoA thioester hydrolase
MPIEGRCNSVDGGAHQFRVRVYYEDTDAGGVVYHASYLKFAERARTEMLRETGFAQSKLSEQLGILFVLRRCVVDFLAPARLDDHLVVASRLVDLRGASLGFEQTIWRDSLELVRLGVKLACMSASGRAARLPAQVRTALAELSGNIWTENGKQRG